MSESYGDPQMWKCDICGAQRQWGHALPQDRGFHPFLLCWEGQWLGKPGKCGKDAVTSHSYVTAPTKAAYRLAAIPQAELAEIK